MLFDTRRIDEGSTLRSVVCIVGAGAAGITLALEMERRGIDTIVLESGGLQPDPETRDLYRGENRGLPYVFADGCRSRYFGGSTNCWGGWCGPLQEHDMAPRDWVPDSGWPFERRVLDAYYERAHRVLKLGDCDYDVGRWVDAVRHADVRRLPLDAGRVQDTLSQFSAHGRFGRWYLDALTAARHVRVFLHANVVEIATDDAGTSVSHLSVRTLSGRSVAVNAAQVVVACGGIENARLLLASNRRCSAGVGNPHDLVGRYFADHPRFERGTVRFAEPWRRNMLHDVKLHYLNRAMSWRGTYFSAQLALSPEVQRDERILNAQVCFNSIFPGEGSDAAAALLHFKQLWHGKADPTIDSLVELWQLMRHPVDAAGFAATRLFKPEWLVRDVNVVVICEPAPQRDSRVTLSTDRDALGMPRACVEWRLGELVKRSVDRTLAVLADELDRSGAGELALPGPLEGQDWPTAPNTAWRHLGTWHHMGTTRMHDSPRHGVVDRNCRVHGMSNLYVAGSSVFPTYGSNFPTTTIVALSLRLADHLAARLQAVTQSLDPAAPDRAPATAAQMA